MRNKKIAKLVITFCTLVFSVIMLSVGVYGAIRQTVTVTSSVSFVSQGLFVDISAKIDNAYNASGTLQTYNKTTLIAHTENAPNSATTTSQNLNSTFTGGINFSPNTKTNIVLTFYAKNYTENKAITLSVASATSSDTSKVTTSITTNNGTAALNSGTPAEAQVVVNLVLVETATKATFSGVTITIALSVSGS